MQNRTTLAKHFADCGFKVGAEVGVCDGYYSEVLCKNIPGLKLYAIDSWDLYEEYRDFRREESQYLKIYNDACEKLKPYNCEIIKARSMDAVKKFEDESLDFVYIDANHAYEFVKEDIREWTKKVRKGGIVAGHDYYKTKAGNMGVINVVDEYIKEHGYKFNRTRWDRFNPHKDDRQPSWFFTK